MEGNILGRLQKNEKSEGEEGLETQYRKLGEELEIPCTDRCYVSILEQAGILIIELDGNRKMNYSSPGLKQFSLYKYIGAEFFRKWNEKYGIHPKDISKTNVFNAQVGEGKKRVTTCIRLERISGEYAWCEIVCTKIFDESGKIWRTVCTVNNVDQAIKSESLLKFRAEYDVTTGIHNQQSFELLTQALLLRNINKKYAVICMDINRFKYINDFYGVEEGNRLLCTVASIISQKVQGRGTCCRMNSDIFYFCMNYDKISDIIAYTEDIGQELEMQKLRYRVTLSFGICLVEEQEVATNIICDRARLALNTVKGSLIHPWAIYDKVLHEKQMSEDTIEGEMETALEQGQFLVYLQPKHNIATGEVMGAEALVRWNHPKKGILTPDHFVPIFERDGFIVMLDYYVWEVTCKILRDWIDRGMTPVPISVNVSRVHASNPEFYKKLMEITDRYDLPKELLELELTESTFAENSEELYHTMEIIKHSGFLFSMDDFGAGYSSLNMLKDVLVDTIKLDREFLNETAITQKGKTIIKYAVEMVKHLGLNVIAEGVETDSQARLLVELGCTMAQGYFFSKPMPISTFEKFVFSSL